VVNQWHCLWPASNRLIFTNRTLYNSLKPNRCFFLTASRFTKVTFRLHVFAKAPPPFLSSQATLHDFVMRQLLLSILFPGCLTQVHVIGSKSQPRSSSTSCDKDYTNKKRKCHANRDTWEDQWNWFNMAQTIAYCLKMRETTITVFSPIDQILRYSRYSKIIFRDIVVM